MLPHLILPATITVLVEALTLFFHLQSKLREVERKINLENAQYEELMLELSLKKKEVNRSTNGVAPMPRDHPLQQQQQQHQQDSADTSRKGKKDQKKLGRGKFLNLNLFLLF